ncbi:unnamed protein product, partial [Staurois parvus]
MSCQSAPGYAWIATCILDCNRFCYVLLLMKRLGPRNAYEFNGFFEYGQGHRSPTIPYCPGAP